jgi:hypothetical protein
MKVELSRECDHTCRVSIPMALWWSKCTVIWEYDVCTGGQAAAEVGPEFVELLLYIRGRCSATPTLAMVLCHWHMQ